MIFISKPMNQILQLSRPKWGIDKLFRYLPSDPQIAFDVLHYERHSFYTRKSFFQWMVRYKNFLQVNHLHLMKMYHYPEVLASIRIEWKHDLVCQWYHKHYHHEWVNPPEMIKDCKIKSSYNPKFISKYKVVKFDTIYKV